MSHRTRFLQLMILGIAGWLVCASHSAVQAQVVNQNLRFADDNQIKTAIDRARQMISSRMPGESDPHAALAVVALVKSGTNPKTAEIQDVCKRLMKHFTSSSYTPSQHHVYEAAVTLLAFANVDAKLYRPQINLLAQFIIANQGRRGQWHYSYSDEGDTSISQYAMLGLWEASRVGYVVPSEVWDKAAAWHIRTQIKDGGFGYHPETIAASMHSMTVAGIGSLRIARRHLYGEPRPKDTVIDTPAAQQPKVVKRNRTGKRFGILEPTFRVEEQIDNSSIAQEFRTETLNASYRPTTTLTEIDNSVNGAVNWMTANFTVDKPSGFPIYYLYGLERASSLAELKTYGNRDWYTEGAAVLVGTQQQGGSWVDSSADVPATSFGILFLVKATEKMIKHDVPRVEFGTGILVGGRGLPDDLKASALTKDGNVKKDKKTPLEELLTQLENPQIPLLESTQSEIIEQVVVGDRAKLIGQVDRLKRLAKHPEAEVRRTALWALGRSDDIRLAPILIASLKDNDIDVFVEARNALRCLSRRVEEFGQKEGPLDAASRTREWQKWKDWYHSVRPYDERDDVVAPRE